MMNLFKTKAQRLAEETDFGRRFGWELICKDQHCADLEYVCWDETTQFWHKYRIQWLGENDLSKIPYEDWPRNGFILRNKRCSQVVFEEYMVAGKTGEYVLLRGVYVPEDQIE